MSSTDTMGTKTAGGGQLVTFQLGKEVFGINIENVKEIVRYPRVTSVPATADYLSGLANLRGVVFPIIDTGVKLGLGRSMITDSTRVLVIDAESSLTGIVVERIRGVENLEDGVISPPPSVLNSDLDARYIKSVVELNNRGIVLELDLGQLCDIRINSSTDKKETLKTSEKEEVDTKTIEEKQVVTFTVAGEEYAFPIDVVKEVLRVGDIVQVPKAPSYIVGILSIRNNILPVVDIRTIFELPSLPEELTGFIDNVEEKHRIWTDEVRALEEPSWRLSLPDLDHCALTWWMETFRTSSEMISAVLQSLKSLHVHYHHVIDTMVEKTVRGVPPGERDNMMEWLAQGYEQLRDGLKALKEAINDSIVEDQRILVVEIEGVSLGILVDRIHQVLRIPETSVETPSSILSSEKADMLRGIAKLDNGKRFILLLDEHKILSEEALGHVMDMGDRAGKGVGNMETTRESDTEEIQYVTFSLGREVFAIEINDIQEINRPGTITSIPRVRAFIEGVMNLRGNVIPVIDLRKRFGMASIKHDDSTRVIIINIAKELTGLIVDSVSEVIRVYKSDIQPPPEMVKDDVKAEFLRGIGRYNKGMFLILDTNRILSEEEQKELKEVARKERDADEPPATEEMEGQSSSGTSQRPMKKNRLKRAERA